jgi:hypothetical protein
MPELRCALFWNINLAARNQLLSSDKTYSDIKSGALVGESIIDKIHQLSPKDDDQKFFRQQCLNLEVQLGQIRC